MIQCPHCRNDHPDLLEPVTIYIWYCSCCAKVFGVTDDDIEESGHGNKDTTQKSEGHK
jgi:ribosomal protein L37AE/L43A